MSATPAPTTMTGPQSRRAAMRTMFAGAIAVPTIVDALTAPAVAQTVAEVTPASIPLSVVPPAPRGDAPAYTLKVEGTVKAKLTNSGQHFRQVSLRITGHDKDGEAFHTTIHVSMDGFGRPYVGRIVFNGYRYDDKGVRTGEPVEDYGHQEFSPNVPGKGSGTRFKDQLSPDVLDGMQSAAAAILKKATALLDSKSPANSPPATPREENVSAEPAVRAIAHDVAAFHHALMARVKPRTASAG